MGLLSTSSIMIYCVVCNKSLHLLYVQIKFYFPWSEIIIVVYQFHLLSTHSDLYYLGLNAIELYDAEGKKIQLDENSKLQVFMNASILGSSWLVSG